VTGLTPGAARKSLGQHFLFDAGLLKRIAISGGPVEGKTVIEAGPGPGGLTRALLDAGVGKLIAVELDDRFAEGLSAWPEATSGRLHVVRGDALEIDEPRLIAEAGGRTPAMIVANLPYNVGTPLVVKWLKAGDWRGVMVLMFQREVALRICAAPGETQYGRLAVLTRAVMQPRIALTVPPGAFQPPPKVESAVVVLTPLVKSEAFEDLDALEAVTAAAFGQRRKMLRSALKALEGGVAALARTGINPTRRAETLTQEEFRRLATEWRGQ
jgi:16S rRNA (adenine1518-N6/adenine1519-N6)-dimethyltransferase